MDHLFSEPKAMSNMPDIDYRTYLTLEILKQSPYHTCRTRLSEPVSSSDPLDRR